MRSHNLYRYAIRRTKRREKLHRAKALLETAKNGDINLLREMRRVVNGNGPVDETSEVLDGETGHENIAEKFKQVYKTLYNSSESNRGVEEILSKLQVEIGNTISDSKDQVSRLTGHIVKEAVMMMKAQKLDITQGFSSDSFKNAPQVFFDQLALIFRSWLMHGTVTKTILSCAFIPLLKSSLKDPSSSESYCAIAGSSLVLRTFERCILLLWGDQLQSDSLQFGFKKQCGTDTATWLVQEVIQHYLNQGSKPIAIILDCTNAFDLA